jgi:hypothetical protein
MKLTVEQRQEIERLVPLAKRLAKRHAKHEDLDDAEGEALMALCNAMQEYDPTRGTTLDAWVKLCITNALNHWMRHRVWEKRKRLAGGVSTASPKVIVDSIQNVHRLFVEMYPIVRGDKYRSEKQGNLSARVLAKEMINRGVNK